MRKAMVALGVAAVFAAAVAAQAQDESARDDAADQGRTPDGAARRRPGVVAAKKAVMIVAQKDFRDEELLEPKAILEGRGIKVTVASRTPGAATGVGGARVEATVALKDLQATDYDAIVFVGGVGAKEYFNDRTAYVLARDAVGKGKVVGAICIAPSILANAGVLRWKKATAFSSEAGNLTGKGAIFTGSGVETDGKIVTADGPRSARMFGEALVRMISAEGHGSASP